jgi:hypothetical protein
METANHAKGARGRNALSRTPPDYVTARHRAQSLHPGYGLGWTRTR